MNPLELSIHRRNTAAFIAADPLTLVLTPQDSVETPAGGFKWEVGAPRTPQVFRLIPLNADRVEEVRSPNGRLAKPVFVIMGTHDALMAQYDKFDHNGDTYQIISSIRPEHSVASVYERKADVIRSSDG